jgi:hypothetical protein
VLARAAGWDVPPDTADSFVTTVCAVAALKRITEAAAILGVDATALGGGS